MVGTTPSVYSSFINHNSSFFKRAVLRRKVKSLGLKGVYKVEKMVEILSVSSN
jgi:hypothetical protein